MTGDASGTARLAEQPGISRRGFRRWRIQAPGRRGALCRTRSPPGQGIFGGRTARWTLWWTIWWSTIRRCVSMLSFSISVSTLVQLCAGLVVVLASACPELLSWMLLGCRRRRLRRRGLWRRPIVWRRRRRFRRRLISLGLSSAPCRLAASAPQPASPSTTLPAPAEQRAAARRCSTQQAAAEAASSTSNNACARTRRRGSIWRTRRLRNSSGSTMRGEVVPAQVAGGTALGVPANLSTARVERVYFGRPPPLYPLLQQPRGPRVFSLEFLMPLANCLTEQHAQPCALVGASTPQVFFDS